MAEEEGRKGGEWSGAKIESSFVNGTRLNPLDIVYDILFVPICNYVRVLV